MAAWIAVRWMAWQFLIAAWWLVWRLEDWRHLCGWDASSFGMYGMQHSRLDESLVVCMAACLVWMAVLLAWMAFWCGTLQLGGRGLLFRRIGRQVGGFDARMSGHLVWLAVWWTWVAVWCVM